MYLDSLKLFQFRNHLNKAFNFNKKFNVIVGNNGAGKTNILEAITYLSITKSTLMPRDADNVMEGQSFFRLEGVFIKHKKYLISYAYENGKKRKMDTNDALVERAIDHIGKFPVIMVHPYDIDLIREGSVVRRKLMDAFLCQIDRTYLHALVNYQKSLKHRNALLKKFYKTGHWHWKETAPFEAIMIKESAVILQGRQAWCEQIMPFFINICNAITPEGEAIDLRYKSQLVEQDLETMLFESREKDIYTQRTNCGIHRDDLLFYIREVPLKKFGSQGQQKTLLIALKVAMVELSQMKYGSAPILLLDDLFGKLDESRIKSIIQYLNGLEGVQIFIADALKKRMLPLIQTLTSEYEIFDIE